VNDMEHDEYSGSRVVVDGVALHRVLDSKGSVVAELKEDLKGRECERIDFDGEGRHLGKTVYEYDGDETKPRLTLGYNESGKLVFRQERGKRPEILD